MSAPVIILNISAARCDEPPVPLEAKLSVPGLALANWTSSLIDFTGTAGWTTTTSGADAIRLIGAKSGLSADEYYAKGGKEIPLGRFGEAEEAANAIVFLASAAASYVTGTSINLDGGLAGVL